MIPIPAHLRRALRGSATLDHWIWLTSLLGGLAYLLLPLLPGGLPWPARVIVKALGVGLLAVLAGRQYRRNGGGGALGLGIALGLSTLGDICLAWRGSSSSFMYGLLAFLLAHLTYLGLFIRRWHRPLRPPVIRLAGTAAFLTFSLFYSHWLSPGLGALAIPVMIYVSAITLMVVASLWANFTTRWVVIGAILFMISDSILAADKFHHEIPASSYLIWASYYLGQYGITIGYLIEHSRKETDR